MMQHLLLIEDDERLGALVVEYLSDAGFHITHALTGTDGLASVHDAGNVIDAIILDLMLPEIDGINICKKLREKKINSAILMLTAKIQSQDKIMGYFRCLIIIGLI